MSEKHHSHIAKVWLGILALAFGCAEPYTPVSAGTVGYLSDRAVEIDALFERTVTVPCHEVCSDASAGCTLGGAELSPHLLRDVEAASREAASRGRPLMLDRARLGVQVLRVKGGRPGPCEVHYRARVESLITSREMEALGITRSQYESDDDIDFAVPAGEVLASQPDYRALAADGRLDVGAIFGQMNPDELRGDDAGYWSARALERHLGDEGMREGGGTGPAGGRLIEGRVGGVPVQVEVVGPAGFGLNADPADNAAVVRSMIARHDVVYVNGHAFQGGLEALWEAGAYASSPHYRVVVLDICWSYFAYVRKIVEAAGAGRVAVVAVPGRVVTGSVDSFALLLRGLIAGAEQGEGETWLGLIGGMNALADARAFTRSGVIDPALREPEVYGVGSLWRPR